MTAPMTREELLACPCCNSEAVHAAEDGVWHLVRCTNRKCGIQSGIFPTKPMAFRTWNTRPGVAQAPWQPIETAPKDGTPIRAYREPAIFGKHQCRVEVKWMVWPDIDPLTEEPEAAWVWPNSPQDDITSSDWLTNGDYYESLEFTHWQPLSVPPSNQGASK